jgi:hypothetical protein
MPNVTKQSDFAAVPQRATIPGQQIPLGYQQITATGSAFGLTPPSGAVFALIQAEAQNIRWRDDGTNPTTTVGMILPSSSELQYNGNLTAIKFIAATAGAIANISYYG